jgi:hypothetical protein
VASASSALDGTPLSSITSTVVEFPPMQKGASFNMEAVKAQIQKMIEARSSK